MPPPVLTFPRRTTFHFYHHMLVSFACFEPLMVKSVPLELFLYILWNTDISVHLKLVTLW